MTAPFFLLLASRSDTAAISFAASAGPEVRLMTPADLSQAGWSFRVGDAAHSSAVIAGEVVPAAAIAGVLIRLQGVAEHDLPHIVAADRAYVAAEMSAFLLAWLTALGCRLVNRPTPQCLPGPMWRPEQWVVVANRLGVPARPVMRRVARENAGAAGDGVAPAATVITIVGRRHIGEGDKALVRRAHALAQAACVDLLAVKFDGRGSGANFIGASPWLDLADERIAAMVMHFMRDITRSAGLSRRSDDIALGRYAG
jgi:hypothetical protein